MQDVADWVFCILGAVFGVGAALKTIVWWKSLGWALSRGAAFAHEIQTKSPPPSTQERYDILKNHGADFRPLGAKSVGVWTANPKGVRRLFDLLYLKTPCFIVEGSILALASALIPDLSSTVRFIGLLIAFWICIYSLLLIFEAIVWYVIAKDYALVWGDLKFAATNSAPSNTTLGDFKGLGAVTVTAILSTGILISVISQNYGGFDHLAPPSEDPSGVGVLVSSFYYVIATLTTVGDNSIAPESVLARIGAGLLNLMVLLTLSFAVSAIAARLQDRS